MTRKAQATLEFTLIFIVTAALLAGLIWLWKGSSDNLIKRQLIYNRDRPIVGKQPRLDSSWSGASSTSVMSNLEAQLNALKDGVKSLSGLSLDQINASLDSANQSIADIQKNLPFLTGFRDMWNKDFGAAQTQEAAAQAQINDLNKQLAAETDPAERDRLSIEIEKAQYGYYTTTTDYADETGSWSVTTYDYSTESAHYRVTETVVTDSEGFPKTTLTKTEAPGNTPWQGVYNSREAWAKDYWTLQQYGVSEGNNQHGLYNNYTPGLSDWTARKTYAGEQNAQAQSNVDRANNVLTGITGIRDKLQSAKAAKSQP